MKVKIVFVSESLLESSGYIQFGLYLCVGLSNERTVCPYEQEFNLDTSKM